jgi:putative addiction module component (TIGR02574 family)
MQTDHVRTEDLDISTLSVEERMRLAEDLWDSVAAETGGLALTQAQRAELDRRLDDLERNPEECEPWDVIRGRIQSRLPTSE